jgi:predicted lipase
MHGNVSDNRASDPLDLGPAGGGGFVVFNRFAVNCHLFRDKCFAYTAISEKLQVIALSFRGTNTKTPLFAEFLSGVIAFDSDVLGGKVQQYFKDGFDLLWPCVKSSIQTLVRNHPNYRVFVTGHSLGAAIANLAATFLVQNKIVSSSQMLQYTFGEPRVGNFDYAYAHDIRFNNSWRVVHYQDIVPHLPPLKNCRNILGGPYQHGLKLFYNSI